MQWWDQYSLNIRQGDTETYKVEVVNGKREDDAEGRGYSRDKEWQSMR